MIDERLMDLDLEEEDFDAVRENGSIRCVFSTTEMMKVGTGTTTRKHVSKIYWFVEERGDKEFKVRQINDQYVPSGEEKVLSLTQLMEEYIPEITFYEEKALPAMEQLEGYLNEGEESRSEGKLYSAEISFNQALAIDVSNVRALFNLGIIYMELGQTDKARDMVGELLNVKSTYEGKNQYLFNEFGIALRKAGLFNEAADYYAKALEFVIEDENLYYNLARTNYERSHWEECVNALEQAFAINPGMEVAHKMVRTIQALADSPDLCARNNKEPVPEFIMWELGRIRGKGAEGTAPVDLSRSNVPDREEGEQAQVGRARSGGISLDDD